MKPPDSPKPPSGVPGEESMLAAAPPLMNRAQRRALAKQKRHAARVPPAPDPRIQAAMSKRRPQDDPRLRFPLGPVRTGRIEVRRQTPEERETADERRRLMPPELREAVDRLARRLRPDKDGTVPVSASDLREIEEIAQRVKAWEATLPPEMRHPLREPLDRACHAHPSGGVSGRTGEEMIEGPADSLSRNPAEPQAPNQ